MQIKAENIENIATGSAFLATGGGGDPYVAQLATELALQQHGPVSLLPLSELHDEALVVALGGVGAPTVSLEKLGNGAEAMWALRALEKHLGRKADALIPFEIGGANSLVPLAAAAMAGVPLLDADGMGRALPEMQMVSFSMYGVEGTPMAIADEFDNSVVITSKDSLMAEKLVRHTSIAMGGICISAEHSMSGAVAKQVSIPNTISLAEKIGAAILANRGQANGFIQRLHELLKGSVYDGCRLLCEGKVVDISRRIDGGFNVGQLRIQAFDAESNEVLVQFRNEYLSAERNGQSLAMVPDLICAIDADTALPVTAENIRYGQRLMLLGIGAPELMKTETALSFVGPRAFGFDYDFIPLENL